MSATTDALDLACEHLSAEALRLGAGGFDLQVRADGRVQIRLLAPAGWASHAALADLVGGGAHPLPSAALATMVRT